MQIYRLTSNERHAFEVLNTQRSDTLMVVSDYGSEIGCGVVYADLITANYADYRALLSETLESERIIEWPEDIL